MKKLILALAVFALTSCKKEEAKPLVEYTFQCDKCTAKIDVANGKQKTIEIVGNRTITDRNDLKLVNIEVYTKGRIYVSLAIDGRLIYNEAKAPNEIGTTLFLINTAVK